MMAGHRYRRPSSSVPFDCIASPACCRRCDRQRGARESAHFGEQPPRGWVKRAIGKAAYAPDVRWSSSGGPLDYLHQTSTSSARLKAPATAGGSVDGQQATEPLGAVRVYFSVSGSSQLVGPRTWEELGRLRRTNVTSLPPTTSLTPIQSTTSTERSLGCQLGGRSDQSLGQAWASCSSASSFGVERLLRAREYSSPGPTSWMPRNSASGCTASARPDGVWSRASASI